MSKIKSELDTVEFFQYKNIDSFQLQRSIDEDRIDGIVEHYKKMIDKYNYILDESILILIKSKIPILYNKKDEKTDIVIVDGQHRFYALKKLLKDPKYNKFIRKYKVDVKIHYVYNNSEAEYIQHNLFKQKPVDKADLKDHQMKQYEETLILELKDKLRFEFNKMDASKIFKDKDYTTKNQQRYNFMFKELINGIRNSNNLDNWYEYNISSDDVINKIKQLIDICRDKYLKLHKDNKIDELIDDFNLNRLTNYVDYIEKNESLYGDVIYLTLFYYKNYMALVNDIEQMLNIKDYE
jgi:hypothetical protein